MPARATVAWQAPDQALQSPRLRTPARHPRSVVLTTLSRRMLREAQARSPTPKHGLFERRRVTCGPMGRSRTQGRFHRDIVRTRFRLEDMRNTPSRQWTPPYRWARQHRVTRSKESRQHPRTRRKSMLARQDAWPSLNPSNKTCAGLRLPAKATVVGAQSQLLESP